MINGIWLGWIGIAALFILAVVLYVSDRKSPLKKFSKISLTLAVIAGVGGIVLALNQQSTTDVQTLAKQAHEALKVQDFQKVAELSKQILAIEPNHAETFAHLGMLHFAMGESKGAIDFFDRALAIDPDNRDAKLFKSMVQASGKEEK